MHLYPQFNQLSGSIPAELGQLGALTLPERQSALRQRASLAELGGQLGFSSLIGLRLQTNQLSGSIPAELGQLVALAQLYLHGNQLSGKETFQIHMEEHNPSAISNHY